MEADTDNKRFTLAVLRDRRESAPGFDKDNWPNMSDRTWAKGIHPYFTLAVRQRTDQSHKHFDNGPLPNKSHLRRNKS